MIFWIESLTLALDIRPLQRVRCCFYITSSAFNMLFELYVWNALIRCVSSRRNSHAFAACSSTWQQEVLRFRSFPSIRYPLAQDWRAEKSCQGAKGVSIRLPQFELQPQATASAAASVFEALALLHERNRCTSLLSFVCCSRENWSCEACRRVPVEQPSHAGLVLLYAGRA